MQPVRIAVLNRAKGVETSFDVEVSRFCVGRDAELAWTLSQSGAREARLGIPSRYVSAEHVWFRRGANDGWLIECRGANPVLLNGAAIAGDQEQAIAIGDRLDVGEYTLLLSKKESVDRITDTPIDAAQVAARIEASIHLALLDAMDLRRADVSADIETPSVQQEVLNHLDRLVTRDLANASLEERRALSRLFVYRLLSFRAISAGSDVTQSRSAMLAQSRTGRLLQAQLDALLAALSKRLHLELTTRSLESDLRKIDAGFDDLFAAQELEIGAPTLNEITSLSLRRSILDLIFGLGPLQDLMEMDGISEVMVVSRDEIFIEKSGTIENSRRAFSSDESLINTIQRIVAPIGRRVDQSSPLVDAHLPDGSRVNAVIPPLALKGPALTIRKFRKTPLTIDDLVRFGALTMTMRNFLGACVSGRKNIVVSGGTGSGKTTLLNCLSSFIGHKERVVTIEDTAELQLKQEHVVTLESRPPNMEGHGEVSIRALVKNALRMRPDRIVVGECRGAEALDMLQAMNTGHDGSMTTGHANTPEDMIRRLETMVLMAVDMPVSAIREQIVSAVDLIVQVQRESDGRRHITYISEVVALDPQSGAIVVEDIFRAAAGGRHGVVQFTGYLPTFTDDLLAQKHLDLGVFLSGGK